MRIAHIRRERITLVKFRARARRLLRRRSALLGARGLAGLVAPFGIHELSVIAVRQSVASDVVPKKTSGGIVNIGLVMIEGKFIGNRTLEVIGSLLAAVGDLPGLFVVIAGNGGGGP